MPRLRLGARRNSSKTKVDPATTTTRTSPTKTSGGPWLSLFVGDFSVLSCGTTDHSTASPTASDTASNSPSPLRQKQNQLRRWSEETAASVGVIVPDLKYQKNPHTATTTSSGRIQQRASSTSNHQVSASVAAKWLSSGRVQDQHGRLSWSSSHYRSRNPRSSRRSLPRSARQTSTKPSSQRRKPISTGDKSRGIPRGTTTTTTEMIEEAKMWKTAVDEQSGRTYYYHTQTRETQWQTPLCLATPEERAAAQAREASTRNFFAAMEANILQSMDATAPPRTTTEAVTAAAPIAPPPDQEIPQHTRPYGLVRTISTMEDSVLADLVGRVPSNHSLSRSTTRSSTRSIPIKDANAGRPDSPSFSDITEESISPVKTVRPKLNSFVRRSATRLRGSMTRLPLVGGSRRMKLVPEDIHEDLSGSSHDAVGVYSHVVVEEEDDDDDDEDAVVQRGLERSAGTLRLQAEVSSMDTDRNVPVPGSSTAPQQINRENSLSLESLALRSNRNVVRHSQWANDSFRHPSFSNDGTFPADSSVQSSRYRSQSSMDAGFRTDSARWMGSSFYTKGGEEDETLMALAAISQEMADCESRDEAQEEPNIPKTPISAIDGLEGLNLTWNDHEHVDDAMDEVVETRTDRPRPQMLRPQSLRTTRQSEDPAVSRPHMKRRNTCGTLYVGSTMAAPDKDATIKCVCGVFRAHVLRSGLEQSHKFSVFNDLESQRNPDTRHKIDPPMPSLQDISQFYRDVFGRAQMEPDCIVISLIYVERLIKVTGGELRPRPSNWRSILFSCMVLSSKVWDDMSMWNADFSQTCPAGVAFTLKRVNELELAVLSALNYQVKVPASEYAKYYFLLRSLLIKSGLGSEDLNTMNPLDVEGAKQLQQVTARYQSTTAVRKSLLGRAKTDTTAGGQSSSNNANHTVRDFRGSKVGLEQLVNM